MSIIDPDFLLKFGEIKFAEENSMCMNDFESALKKHFNGKERLPRGRYKFGEVDNSYVKDFEKSFKAFFE